MYESIHYNAAQMLECDPGQLHYEFVDYLNKINSLTSNLDGQANSRQIAAVAIASWELATGKRARGE